MPYPYYYPYYQPSTNYADPLRQQQYQQPMQQVPMQQMPMQQAQQPVNAQSGINWVQGEEGAKGFIVAPGGTAGPISIAIAVEGEALGSATATVTPAAVSDEFNVSAFAYVDVPCGCCVTISVKNIGTQTIELQNANLIVTRVC